MATVTVPHPKATFSVFPYFHLFFYCYFPPAHQALEAVRLAVPDAEFEVKCRSSYPIKVIITAPDGSVVWQGSQKKLYRKYASDRTAAIAAIKKAAGSWADTTRRK